MIKLLTNFTENVNTGVGLEILPFIIAGVILVAVIVVGIVMSQISKNKKKKRKDQKKMGSSVDSQNRDIE